MAKFGIIGGTGFYKLEGLPIIREEDVTNKYGTPVFLLPSTKVKKWLLFRDTEHPIHFLPT